MVWDSFCSRTKRLISMALCCELAKENVFVQGRKLSYRLVTDSLRTNNGRVTDSRI